MISYKEAQSAIIKLSNSFGVEYVNIDNALNRVISKPIYADRDYPPFNRSTMDGYAIRYIDFKTGITSFTIKSTIFAGFTTSERLDKGECFKIMTGAPVPSSADTVIKREDVIENDFTIDIPRLNIQPGQCIATKGGDLKEKEIILNSGIQLNATTMGGLAVVGIDSVQVQKLPSIVIFSTGDEVITGTTSVLPHQIRESNSIVLLSLLKKYEISTIKRIHLSDNENQILESIQKELDNDIIIISGGVSAGDVDYIPAVLDKLGFNKIIHKVAIRPGKPFLFAKRVNGPVVFALPGNPVSAQVCYKLFVESYIRSCFGLDNYPIFKLALLHQKIKKVALDEFFPCYLSQTPFGIKACSFNTSGDITSTLLSDGIAIHPQEKELLNQNEIIDFIPW